MQQFVVVMGLPLLVCIVMVLMLGYLGLHVLSREIIFIDIALAQVAAVGAIAAHLAFGVHGDSPLCYVASFCAALAVAAFYAFVRRRITQIPLEAVIGVSYAIAAAGALFLLGVAPGGHVHVQHMLAGSILWTTWKDVTLCALVFGPVGLVFFLARQPFRDLSENYTDPEQTGGRLFWWDFLFYALVSIVVTVAVRVGGVLLVFAFLIMPATASALFSRNWRTRLGIAWLFGTLGSVLGLSFADRLDFSVGPSVALFLGGLLATAGAAKMCRPLPRLAIAGTALTACLVLLFAPGPTRGDEQSERTPAAPIAPVPRPPAPALAEPPADGPSFDTLLERAETATELEALFPKAPDAAAGAEVVCRVLELDRRAGARLAVTFLKHDPPLFFRQQVIKKLDTVFHQSFGFDARTPFADPRNTRAVAALRQAAGLE